MISAASSPLLPPSPSGGAAVVASPQAKARLDTEIASELKKAPPGANVQVAYRYGKDANGALIVVAAEVTVTERKTQEQPSAQAREDIVDIRYGKESEDGLSNAERAYLRQLQAADTAVRNHEALHFRAAGGLGALPEYQTITGPDGRQYAVAGSVNVSGTRGADGEKAAREAATLAIAATAPGDASAADFGAARSFGQKDAAPQARGQNVDITA